MKKLRSLPFVILAVIIVMLMTASFVEKATGTLLYSQWWFIGLWAALALSGTALLLKVRLWKKPATMMLHVALLFVLAGALVTHLSGMQGVVHLRLGAPQQHFLNNETQQEDDFPFLLVLNDFSVENYPGTASPMDYRSVVSVVAEGETLATITISMNNIGEYGGYRFYQSAFDSDRQGTILAMSHDPWGIGLTYTGYGLLFLSMLLLMVLPGEGLRKLLREERLRQQTVAAALAAVAAALPLATATATPRTLPADVAEQFADLYAYHNGRICPVQTIARDFTVKLYGKPSYKGLTPEQVLTGWMLFPAEWTEEPVIKVKGDVATIIGIDGRYASYQQFHGASGYKLQPHLTEASPANRSIHEADEKMNILLMLFNGNLLKIFPYSHDGQLQWYSQGDRLPQHMPHDKWLFVTKSMDYVGELAWTQDYSKMSQVIAKMKSYQQKEGAGLLPSERLFRAEKLYNQADHTRPLAMLLLTVGLLAFFTYLAAWLKGRRPARWVGWGLTAMLVATIAYQLFIIGLRGYVSGHLPLSNGHETMQFMSLCVLLLTLVSHRRYTLAMPFGLLLAGLTMLVAMMGEANPQITLLMPVLASPLLSLHVVVIMVGYTLLAFTMLNGITALALHRHPQQMEQLTRISHLMLFPATFCLAAGIFIGAIWANQSWGRYWAWDPKETWALVTLLVYAVGLHRKSLAWLRRPLWFHLYMVLAFLSILMTYFGVNFVLGGMHAYA